MPDNCAILGCPVYRSPGIGLYKIPVVSTRTSQPELIGLAQQRAQAWLAAINRTDNSNPKNWRICERHFISGLAFPQK